MDSILWGRGSAHRRLLRLLIFRFISPPPAPAEIRTLTGLLIWESRRTLILIYSGGKSLSHRRSSERFSCLTGLRCLLASPSVPPPLHSTSRTPLLKEEDLKQEDPIAILSKNLPDEPHDYIFGKSREASSENAVEQSKMRKATNISVYVVSTNRTEEVLLATIWKTVPSRFFVMTGDDFFKKEEGRYDTMGTDRLATLTGAVHLHGHPALVFDGGTATTYSATDSDGKIMGGGIGPGIQSKFRSLRNDTDALPEISSEEVIARVKEAQKDGKPLPTFARNTQEAMIVDNFQEFALKGRNVIEQWLEKAYKETTPAGGTMVNADRRVLCTGGDGDILMQLLQPHHGGLIEHIRSDGEKSNKKSSNTRYEVQSSKHLIHYGIACVLSTQYMLCKGNKLPYGEYVGKRVAKHFNVEADDGDNIFRGKVAAVIEVEGEDPDFRIKYDDGDSEDVTVHELAGEYFRSFLCRSRIICKSTTFRAERTKYACPRFFVLSYVQNVFEAWREEIYATHDK